MKNSLTHSLTHSLTYLLTYLLIVGFIGCSNENPMGLDTTENNVKPLSYSKITPENMQNLKGKNSLNVDDINFIFSLSRTEREEILKERDWHLLVYQGNSYIDNVLNYQLENKANIKSKELEEIKKACLEKEKCIPWEKFNNTERWIPSENDVMAFSMSLNLDFSKDSVRNDHQNACDYEHFLSQGDPVVVHDGASIQGWWRHGGIGYVLIMPGLRLWRRVISAYGDRGVIPESYEIYNKNYDKGALLSVNTTWTKKLTAQNYACSKIGYPYNHNWGWKWDTNRYYCFSIIWAAYYRTSPRVDIDATNHWWIPWSYNSVSGDDIYNDGNTYVVKESW